MKRFLAGILAAVLVVSLLAAFPGSAAAEEARHIKVNRFNVVLVVDKSGSLHNDTSANGRGTDNYDLRFDSIKLFLALLTESGNNVGAVLFDSEVKEDRYVVQIEEMKNQKDKDMLVSQISTEKVGGDTNIGLALDRATKMLLEMKKESDLPCLILLLSDGKTDFSKGTVPSVSKAVEEARTLGEKASETARANDIRIYSIMLGDGKKVDSEAVNEMRLYTDESVPVTTADELTRAFREFYTIINNTQPEEKPFEVDETTGYGEVSFYVPSYGLEEVNIVIEHPADGKEPLSDSVSVAIVQPDDSLYPIDSHRVDTAHYIIIKIPKPKVGGLAVGEWVVKLRGKPGDTLYVSKFFNSSLTLDLSCSEDSKNLSVNKPCRFTLSVQDAYIDELSDDDLESMTPTLHLVNQSTGKEETREMQIDKGGYSVELVFDKPARYEVSVSLAAKDGAFRVKSGSLEAQVFAPAPQPTRDESDPLKAKVHFSFFNAALSDPISFEGLFVDPKGTELSYEISDNYGDRITLDGEAIVVARRGMKVNSDEVSTAWEELRGMRLRKELLSFDLIATDSYQYGVQTCSHPVVITVTDSRFITILGLGLLLLSAAVLTAAYLVIRSRYRCKLAVTITATVNGIQTKLLPVYNFNGSRSLKKLGLRTAGHYRLVATPDPMVCLFKGPKFSVKGQSRPTSSERISGGLAKTIIINNGVELNISAMTMRF